VTSGEHFTLPPAHARAVAQPGVMGLSASASFAVSPRQVGAGAARSAAARADPEVAGGAAAAVGGAAAAADARRRVPQKTEDEAAAGYGEEPEPKNHDKVRAVLAGRQVGRPH
jgi:hypothetical protein